MIQSSSITNVNLQHISCLIHFLALPASFLDNWLLGNHHFSDIFQASREVSKAVSGGRNEVCWQRQYLFLDQLL